MYQGRELKGWWNIKGKREEEREYKMTYKEVKKNKNKNEKRKRLTDRSNER